jgi:hypothetical protein
MGLSPRPCKPTFAVTILDRRLIQSTRERGIDRSVLTHLCEAAGAESWSSAENVAIAARYFAIQSCSLSAIGNPPNVLAEHTAVSEKGNLLKVSNQSRLAELSRFAGPFDNFALISCSGQAKNERSGSSQAKSRAQPRDLGSVGARDRNRTGTFLSELGILSPVRLPVSPPGRTDCSQCISSLPADNLTRPSGSRC